MEINALPVVVTKDEAKQIALNGRGSFLAKMFTMNKKVYETRLHYIEFKLVTMEVVYSKSGFRKSNNQNLSTLKILVNGSTGAGSVVQDIPKSKKVKNIDKNIIQYSDKDDKRVRAKANKMSMRIAHRFMGGMPETKIISIESIFRPYWVVFFGEVKENKRVRYLPIEADGFIIRRGM